MPSAIVTGATGILGRQIVHELGAHPTQWPTVHALSRSKKESYPSNIIHNHIDLTSSASDMASDLKNVRGEYIFFAAYLQKDTEQENSDVNGAMLQNFLEALKGTGAVKDVKRIVLVTGCKQYGVHLGQAKNPMEESDPWVEGDGRPPNFYYTQQRILHQFCKDHGKEWVVTYPNDVIGYAEGNFMNLATALGIYATVTKELSQPLTFPGSERFYFGFDSFTSSKLHAKFCVWAALEPRAANEAFNVVNGDVESWLNMWPKLAKRFGLTVKKDQFKGLSAGGQGITSSLRSAVSGAQNPYSGEGQSVMELQKTPPLVEQAPDAGLEGSSFVQQGIVEQNVDLMKWSQRGDVKEAWEKIAEREGLDKSAFEKATWGFLGFVLGRNYDLVISMSKARGLGWTGYQDSWESLDETFGELEGARMLPKLGH